MDSTSPRGDDPAAARAPHRRGWDEATPLTAAESSELRAAIAETCGEFSRFDVPLGAASSYKVGGVVGIVVEPRTVADLTVVSKVVAALDPPVFVFGKGSNLLVSDEGWNGLVIRLSPSDDSEFKSCTFADEHGGDAAVGSAMIAELGASRFWPQLVKDAAKAGFGGLEWTVGIPGTVGGAMRMNAGISEREASGQLRVIELRDQLIAAQIVNLRTGSIETRLPEDLDLAHRHSNIDDAEVVVSVTVRGHRRDGADIEADLAERRATRKKTQEVQNTAGSVWRNRQGSPTSGQLIDGLGLRGHRIGTAQVSTVHCNFIRTEPNGRAADVVAVMEHVWTGVHAAHRFGLVQETEFLGLPRVDTRMAAAAGLTAGAGRSESGDPVTEAIDEPGAEELG